MDQSIIITCVCDDPSHISQIYYYENDKGWPPELYWSVQLNSFPLLHRLWRALRYIFGRPSRYGSGHWDSGSIDKPSAVALIAGLRRYIDHLEAC